MTERVRVATWNIHGSIGRDGFCLRERTARIVKDMGADVVALQEVDGRTHLRRKPQAFERLADLLGGHLVEARLFGRPGREHGNLLWSRWPIRRQSVHLLPGGHEQRGVIDALIETPGGTDLRVLATHLSLSPLARRRQTRTIVHHLGHEPVPTVLLGDLNEWLPSGPVHRGVTQVLPMSLRPASWPSRRPFVALDRIYTSADFEIEVVPAPAEAAGASDHLPAVADLVRIRRGGAN